MDVVKQLKQKPLVDFFETHLNISLIKAGNKFRCLCPIHSDSEPSFYIDPSKNKCSCYGKCGLYNGDIIDFTSKYKSLSFNESIYWLASKYKIPYKVNSNISEKNNYYDICNFVADFYFKDLIDKKSHTRLAVNYLQSRKLTKKVVENFKLGYAPNPSELGTWEFLTSALEKKGFSLEVCEKLGLIKKSNKGTFFDSFLGRIIFPIYDIQDRCIGFNSRILPYYAKPDNSIPKYLLSKESDVFKKNNFIYGLNNTLKYIKQEDLCYIVEGCFDCYKMFSYGYKNTIPLLGGELFKNFENKSFEDKNNSLYSFTKYFCGLPDVSTYVFLMDPDKAGIKYSITNGAELIKHGKNVLIGELTKDPDDSSQAEIQHAISKALPFIDFYLKYNYRYNTIEHKLSLIDKLFTLLNGIGKEQAIMCSMQLSRKLNIPLGVILFRLKLENEINYGEIFKGYMKHNQLQPQQNIIDLEGDIW